MGDILYAALIWVLGCTVAFLIVVRCPSDRCGRASIVLVLFGTFLLRAVPALGLQQGASYEMHLFQATGARLLAGENVVLTLPYLPCFVYWMAASDWLSRTIGLDFTFWLKLPSILADVLMILVIDRYLASAGWSDRKVRKATILYAVNPVTILVSGYHGQFDTIPSLFLMVSVFLLAADQHKRRRHNVLASLSLGLGIFLKTWPGLLALCVTMRRSFRHKVAFLLGAAVTPLMSTMASVFVLGGGLPDLLAVARRALQAGAIPGWWGYTGLINGARWLAGATPAAFDGLLRYKLPIVLLPVGVVVWLTRRAELHDSVFWSLLTLFAFAPGLGLQSLSWLVPLFIVRGDWHSAAWYVGLSALHMVISYWGIHLTPNLYSVLPAGVTAGIVQLSAVPVWIFLVTLLGGWSLGVGQVRYEPDRV